MSLINKMLRDLESRQDGSDPRKPKAIYEDLQASRAVNNRTPHRVPMVAIALVGVAAVMGVAAWYLMNKPAGTAPEPAIAVTPPPVTPETPAVAAAPVQTPQPASVARPPVVQPRPAVRREGPKTVKPPPTPPPVRRAKPVAAKPMMAAAPVARPGQMEKVVRPLSTSELAESAHREAAVLLQQGRSGEAEQKLRTALGHQPGHAAARELLIGLLLQRGARDEARQQLETGIAQSPGHFTFHRLLARLHVDAGQEAQALALLESINARARNDIEYQRFLAALYQRAGRHADAVKAYRQAVTLRPYDGRAWLGLGISLEALEHWPEAATAYQRALAGQGLDERLADYARQRTALVKSKR